MCHCGFTTKRALAVHARHAHGYRTHLKYFALADGRFACGTKYISRCKFLAHLKGVENCQPVHHACFVPASEETVALLDQIDLEQARVLKARGWLPTKAFLPATRIPGPTLPPADSEDARQMKLKWQARTQSGNAFEGPDGHSKFTSEAPL